MPVTQWIHQQIRPALSSHYARTGSPGVHCHCPDLSRRHPSPSNCAPCSQLPRIRSPPAARTNHVRPFHFSARNFLVPSKLTQSIVWSPLMCFWPSTIWSRDPRTSFLCSLLTPSGAAALASLPVLKKVAARPRLSSLHLGALSPPSPRLSLPFSPGSNQTPPDRGGLPRPSCLQWLLLLCSVLYFSSSIHFC